MKISLETSKYNRRIIEENLNQMENLEREDLIDKLVNVLTTAIYKCQSKRTKTDGS